MTTTKKRIEDAVKSSAKSKTTSAKTVESREWLRTKAKTKSKENTLRRRKTRQNLLGDESKVATSVQIGQMYLFSYDAKFKKTLPYWDFHPIVFPIDFKDGGFIGLNLHYLPPLLRAKLLDAILDLPVYKTEKQRAKMSYDIISAFMASDIAKPTIHRYLLSHFAGPLIEIQRDEWDYVAFLPLVDWRSMTGSVSSSRVYADSKRRM
jgi:hypothetical protein